MCDCHASNTGEPPGRTWVGRTSTVGHTDAFTAQALSDILDERALQDAKWGVQGHDWSKWLAILMEEVGEVARAGMEAHWRGGNWEDYRKEAIQVAAVACAMVEAFTRVGPNGSAAVP